MTKFQKVVAAGIVAFILIFACLSIMLIEEHEVADGARDLVAGFIAAIAFIFLISAFAMPGSEKQKETEEK